MKLATQWRRPALAGTGVESGPAGVRARARAINATETKANWKVFRMAVPQSLAQKPSA